MSEAHQPDGLTFRQYVILAVVVFLVLVVAVGVMFLPPSLHYVAIALRTGAGPLIYMIAYRIWIRHENANGSQK